MKCLSCDVVLKDQEASRKFLDAEHIPNPEDRYIGLCNRCLGSSDLSYYNEDPTVDDVESMDIPADLSGDLNE